MRNSLAVADERHWEYHIIIEWPAPGFVIDEAGRPPRSFALAIGSARLHSAFDLQEDYGIRH